MESLNHMIHYHTYTNDPFDWYSMFTSPTQIMQPSAEIVIMGVGLSNRGGALSPDFMFFSGDRMRTSDIYKKEGIEPATLQ
jgi:hypothetical protein